MHAATTTIAHTAAQVSRLRQFIRWAFITTIVFSIVDVVLWLSSPNWLAVLNMGADGLLMASLALAYVWTQRQRVIWAAWLICGTLWIFTLVLALTDPWNAAAMVFVPLLAVISVLTYVERGSLLWMNIGGVVVTVLVYVFATQVQLDPTIAAPEGSVFQSIGALFAAASLSFFVLNQFHSRLRETLDETQRINTVLRQERAELEVQVGSRTAELQMLLTSAQERNAEMSRLLTENARQRSTIRQQSVPVLPISSSVLVLPLVGFVDSERLVALQQEALQAAERTRARVLILDITGVALVDRAVAQGLIEVVQALQLLGVTPWVVGIRPEVAQALVELQLDLTRLHTAATLQDVLPTLLPKYEMRKSNDNLRLA
jgi:rsbT co-antagonist protein RsbR